jgi:hypothetical protein
VPFPPLVTLLNFEVVQENVTGKDQTVPCSFSQTNPAPDEGYFLFAEILEDPLGS